MLITVNYTVNKCRDCPSVTNTAQRHNDPFTSAPHPTIWFCTDKKGPDIIMNPDRIDSRCPHNVQQEVAHG